MSSKGWLLLAASAGAASFAAALYFQYFQGLPPCKLCIWQRYALGAGIGFALLGAFARPALLGALGALSFLAEAGIAMYHSGVERKWWPGPGTCSGASVPETFDPGSLLKSLSEGPPLPQCDEIPWALFGLSMANWNVLLSLGMALLCVFAVLRSGPRTS